ncbi:MAG: SCO family protein [Chthoniobacteraceae bacterium]
MRWISRSRWRKKTRGYRELKKTGSKPLLPIAKAPASASRERQVGEVLTDVPLLDSTGKPLHLAELRGNAVALTFIYTRCPLPTFCPLMNRNLHETQSLLQRLAPAEKWRLISLTLDPKNDTPTMLANCAANFEADAKRWIFASTPEENLQQLGDEVGLTFSTSGGTIYHNLRTVVLRPDGRIAQIFNGNTWTPQELTASILAAIHPRN